MILTHSQVCKAKQLFYYYSNLLFFTRGMVFAPYPPWWEEPEGCVWDSRRKGLPTKTRGGLSRLSGVAAGTH